MNRIFRKKNMRWIAVLLSVAVLSGSMDVNMLHVQAAQEQSAYAEDEEGIMHDDAETDKNAGQLDDNAGADDGQPADADNNDDSKQDDAESEDDGDGMSGDAESGDNAGLQDGEKPGNDADPEEDENQQEEEPGDDAELNEDDAVDDESRPASSKVKPMAEGDTDPAPSQPVEIGVSISGIAIADKIYDGRPSTCTGNVVLRAKIGEGGAEEVVTGATVSYSISGETFDGVAYNKTPTSINTEMPKDAGTYTLKVTVSGSDEKYIYKGESDYPFTISQKQVIIAAEDKQVKITETTAPKYTYRISGLVSGESLKTEPKLSCESGEANFGVPGQYSIAVSGADAGANYSIVYQPGTLTVLDKELATISGFSVADKVYDGKKIQCKEPTVTGGGQPITDYEYRIYGITENGEEYRKPETGAGSTAAGINADMPTDAGRYKVTIKVPSDNPAYKGNWQYDFAITRKKVTITADNITIKKGEGGGSLSHLKFRYDADGFVEGENPFENDASAGDSVDDDSGKPREPSFSCSAKDTNTPGQYAIVPSGAFAGANYTIEYQPGILTILDEESVSLTGIEINGGRNSKIYDGKPIEFNLTPKVQKDGTLIPESELKFEYAISGTLADEDSTAYSSIGDMTDPDNRPKDTGQYILEVRVFQVTKSEEKNPSSGDDATKDDTAEEGSDTTGNESVSREEIFRQEYPFTITPRAVSVTVKDMEITAGDPMPAPAEDETWYEVGGLGFLTDDDFETKPEFVCELEDTETPGVYPITAANADAGFNYTIAYVPGKLTIVEREVVKTRELVRIVAPNPVLNIQNGTPIGEIELPEKVYIKTKELTDPDGVSADAEEWTHQVDVEWKRSPAEGTSYSSGIKTAQRFILHGTAVLPADVDAGVVSTTVVIEVSVREEITSREQVKNPTASVPSGTAVRRGTKITLSCETEGAEIYYTLDDKNPPTKEKGLRYTWPIEVSKYTVIWARAYKDGCPESEIVKFSYYINSSIVGPGEDDDPDGPQVPPEDIPSDGRIPSGLWVTENAESAYPYTGKAIKPVVRVYDHKTLLVEKKDYTISYKNNVNAADKNDPLKPPTITITGKGNYSGKLIRKFTITPKDISDEDVSVDDITLAYNAKKPKAQKPTPTVMWKNKKLTNKKDYTVPDDSYTDVDTHTITVTGCGNYMGEKKFEFTITDKIPASALTVSKIPDQAYTGKEIEPKPEVRYKGEQLSLNQNYTLEWENNTEVGTGVVIVRGVKDGRYVGTRRVTFKIKAAASLSKANVELETASVTYTGEKLEPAVRSVTLRVGGEIRSLVKDTDYEVSYQNNVKAGKATATFTGKGAYDGKIKKTFTVTPLNIESKEVTVTLGASYPYAKGGAKPEPKVTYNKKALTPGKDYTLSYKQNDAAGNIATVTVKGKGNFGGSTIRTFTVTPQDIRNVTVNAADKFYRNKKNIYKTTVRLIDSTGKPLSAGSDYDKEIKYTYADDVKDADNKILWAKGTEVNPEDIIPAGTRIQVEVNARGNNYTGSVTGTYRIAAANISKAKVTIPSQSYTGKEIKPDSQIDVRVDGVKLTPGTDYEIVGYSNNVKKGTGKAVIHGLGDYGGTRTVSFKIVSKALGGQ